MQSAAPELIDLSRRDARQTLDEYGVGPQRARTIKAAARRRQGRSSRPFATNCLLARRLVERGVRFVNLYPRLLGPSQQPRRGAGLQLPHGRPADRRPAQGPQAARPARHDAGGLGVASSAARRWARTAAATPSVTGRDHHPFAFSLWMAGGGIKGGQVIGKTDEIGWAIVEDPVHVNDLHATILHLFGLDHLRLTYRFQGRDFRLTDVAGKVVDEAAGVRKPAGFDLRPGGAHALSVGYNPRILARTSGARRAIATPHRS